MYTEGMSKSAIARVLNLPYGTIARWTYEVGKRDEETFLKSAG